MKTTLFPLLIVLLFFASCETEKSTATDSLPMQVAQAYGFGQLDDVQSIAYTWNVRRDSATVMVRDWKWDLVKGEVSYADADTSLSYLIAQKSEEIKDIDHRFINDKYWLLFPFQMAWDEGYSTEITEGQTSPINGDATTKITVLYNNEDGYTPGDAYDVYVDDQKMIKEWVFRKGNAEEGRAFTWENEKDFGGIKIALDHRMNDGEKIIWFTNVEVVKK
jgi:hypothetical protein